MHQPLRLYPVLLLLLWTSGTAFAQDAARSSPLRQAWSTVQSDYGNFYSGERWRRVGVAFGVAGVMANTQADQEIRNGYQDHVRSAGTDHLAGIAKDFGEGMYVIPLSLAAAGIGAALPQDAGEVGAWGAQTFRAYLVGGPALLAAQQLTGGSRPAERDNAAHWRPFSDNNGVSGHAFIGAVPFITLAHMSDNTALRDSAYAASALAAWSRINDDAHFASQALLGWYMAYEATDAVAQSAARDHRPREEVTIEPWRGGARIELAYQW